MLDRGSLKTFGKYILFFETLYCYFYRKSISAYLNKDNTFFLFKLLTAKTEVNRFIIHQYFLLIVSMQKSHFIFVFKAHVFEYNVLNHIFIEHRNSFSCKEVKRK